MALTKQYRIEIQLDSAQQALDAAIKKLNMLDKSLEGVNRDGAIGQGIVKEMAAAAAEVDKLTKQVSGFEQGLDKLVPLVPGSVGALRQEVIELEAQLENGVVGSAALGQAIQQLGDKKSQLRELANAVNAANPRAQARAFAVFAGALTGAVGVASTAAQVFGLSSDTADKWAQKMQGLVGVLFSVEQISKALNGENVALAKSVVAGAKSWLGFGEAATAGGRAARVALASTGIGLLLVALGALYALWQDFGTSVKSSESKFTAFKATVMGGLQALWAATKDYYLVLYKLVTFDFPGAAETARKSGQDVAKAYAEGRAGVIDEARRAEIAHEAELTDRYLDILKARGTDTLALEVANAKRKLEAQEEGSKKQLDAARDYNVLRDQLQKRNQDEQKAGRLAFLNGLASAEAARGADAFAQQLKAKKAEQAQLLQAQAEGQYITAAQLEQAQNELDDLQIAHDKQLADKRRALLVARLQADLTQLEAGGREQLTYLGTQAEDELKLSRLTNQKQIALAVQQRANLLAQAQVDKAAVVAADAELYKLRLEATRLYNQQQVLVIQEGAALRKKTEEALLNSADRRAKFLEIDPQAVALAKRSVQRASDEVLAEIELRKRKAEADADVGGNLLIKLFGLTDEQAQKTKGIMNNFMQQAGALAGTVLSLAQDAADARLAETQATLQAVTDQLSKAQSAANDTASKLEGASGAKRDYLIKKLQQQRTEEERLAASKAKAAAAEQAAEREKAKLTKENTQLTLAAGLASTIASGQESVLAAVKIISGAASVPFPADIFAIGAGLAVVVAALAQARALGKTFADGGVVEGPSHALGGIQMWHRSGAHLGEMEGGEFVVNRAATAKNRGLLEMINEAGRTQVLPPPAGHFASGGLVLPRGTAPSGGQVMVQAADLSELIATNREMASHLQGIRSSNQQIADYGPAQLTIGPGEARQIDYQKQQADQAEGFATL